MKNNLKTSLKTSMRNFAVVVVASALPVLAQAQEGPGPGGHHPDGMLAMAAGLAIGIAALGGALGQGRAAASALDGIARNPAASGKILTPMIIGLALIESLVIYALVIAFLILNKIA